MTRQFWHDGLIHYLCVAPGHRPGGVLAATVHGGGWAACPAGAPDGHDWRDIPGVTLADLRVLLGHRDPARFVEDHRG